MPTSSSANRLTRASPSVEGRRTRGSSAAGTVSSRNRQSKAPLAPRNASATGGGGGNNVVAAASKSDEVRWQVDGTTGHIVNFDLRKLRVDITRRLSMQQPLYTLEECRMLIVELVRCAAKWQEEELTNIMYLADTHAKLVPNADLHYQWPAAGAQPIPFATPDTGSRTAGEGAIGNIAVLVEELNRSIVRMIDRLWNDRRERLLLAARILDDVEPMLDGAKRK